MRITTTLAWVVAVSALVAGCSKIPAAEPGPTQLTPIPPSRGGAATPSPSPSGPITTTSTVAARPPAAGAPVSAAISWVEAAAPADAADFQVAIRGGATTSLGEDVAFTTTSGISCMTDKRRGSAALACLVDLTDPPPQPPDVYGAWKGGWVDYDGAVVQIGSAHGDPGRFAAGRGVPLPADRSLSFGDFRCRADATVLVCVNFARQTAVRYADSGIDTFGCTRREPPTAGIGIEYTC